MRSLQIRLRNLTGLAALTTAAALLVTAPLTATARPSATSADPPGPATTTATWKSLPGDTRKLDLNGTPVPPAVLSRRAGTGETVTLTLKHLDGSGSLTANAATAIANLDWSLNTRIDIGDGEVQLQLPKGRYLLASNVLTGPVDDQTANFLVQPLLELQGDTTLELDARQAKPLEVTVDEPAARSFLSGLYLARRMDDGGMIHTDLAVDRLDRLATAQLGPEVPADEVTSSLATYWAIPGAAGDFADSPFTYNTLNTVRGKFFTGFQREVRRDDLARLDSTLHTTSPELSLWKSITMLAPDMNGAWGRGLLHSRPGTVTEYVEAGVEAFAGLQEGAGIGETFRLVTDLSWGPSRNFEAGRRYDLNWNKAVLGPNLGESSAKRYGNLFSIGIGLYDDQAGNGAWGLDDSAATRLYRDGKLVAETAQAGNLGRDAEVEPGQAEYRLETRVDRPDLTGRSTDISAAWTFRSDSTGKEGEALPLWVVRFQPAVGLSNDLANGPIGSVPFTLSSLPGASVGRPGLPSVQVSGDGGKTWRPASVVPNGQGKYVAVFANPAGAKTISLRAQAGDSAGNTVEQTLVDAYALR